MKFFQLVFIVGIFLIASNIFGQGRAAANYIVEDVPGELKINVNIWGYINFPGRYGIYTGRFR